MSEPLRLSLFDHPEGVEAGSADAVTFDVATGEAHFGPVVVAGHALTWELHRGGSDGSTPALLSAEVDLDAAPEWLMRCDRIDFDPGGIAHRHTHPGPGIRCLLSGSIRIETAGTTSDYAPFEAWFESGPEPVLAHASAEVPSSFVRVMLLPSEWAGQRTIRYVDPADSDKPKTQRATVYLEEPVAADLSRSG